jgi:hypothetical protein
MRVDPKYIHQCALPRSSWGIGLCRRPKELNKRGGGSGSRIACRALPAHRLGSCRYASFWVGDKTRTITGCLERHLPTLYRKLLHISIAHRTCWIGLDWTGLDRTRIYSLRASLRPQGTDRRLPQSCSGMSRCLVPRQTTHRACRHQPVGFNSLQQPDPRPRNARVGIRRSFPSTMSKGLESSMGQGTLERLHCAKPCDISSTRHI